MSADESSLGSDGHNATLEGYMWDYQSDLATTDNKNFVNYRPLVSDSTTNPSYSVTQICDDIDYNCSTFDHVRMYIESCCDADIDTTLPSGDLCSSDAPHNQTPSTSDLYIDDSLHEITSSGDQSRVANASRDEPLSMCQLNCNQNTDCLSAV
jgi:hypothetical protein